MNKSIVLLIIGGIIATLVLYSLPRVVVNNEKANPGTSVTATANRDNNSNSGNPKKEHNIGLSKEQIIVLENLKTSIETSKDEQKETAIKKLIDTFVNYNKYDSAALYSEKLLALKPSLPNTMLVGNLYKEGSNYALDEQKANKMGEKARFFYDKILEKNPENLDAKSNKAMTYVNSNTPMTGILLLREVIQKDPENLLALYNLGLLSIKSNQFEKAVGRFRQILKIEPNNTKALLNLGYSLAELKQTNEARKTLENVILQTKDNNEKLAAQEILSSLSK